MKKIAIMVSIGFILIHISLAVHSMALCANTDYNIFLTSQGTVGPADLINENAYETKTQKFNLSYDLINLTPDVLQARIELYRYLDEEAPNDGWKLEETLMLDPPFQSSTPIVFEDLKRGKTYSITLIVVTDMPNILLGDGSPPIDMTVKTIYFLWPKEHGMHLSATTSFEGEPRREHFKMKWSAADGAAKTKVKARHSDNTENPIVESSSEGELTFSREEVWSWPADDLSSISVDALDSSGTLIGTTGFFISPVPFKDYKILPCIPPKQSDPESADLSGSDDKILNDGIIKVVVSETYGGAFFTLKLLSQNVNLINNAYVDGTPDGLLCQTAVTRKNDRWAEFDNSMATQERWLTEDGLHLRCGWENDPDGNFAPSCYQGDDKLFHWNQNQAGTQVGCGTTDNHNWGVYLRKHDNSYICKPYLSPQLAQIIIPRCYPSKTFAPTYANTSTGGTTSPIMYCSILPDWVHYDELPTNSGPDDNGKYWNFQGQPKAAIWSEVELIPSFNWQGSQCSGIKITSRYAVHCDCVGKVNCHCADISFPQFSDSPLNNQKAYEFGAAIQNWIFFGSEYVTHAYKFDKEYTGNCFGMVDRPRCSDYPSDDNCIYDYGDNANIAKEGWKKKLDEKGNWVPYTLLSTDVINNKQAFILIYSPDVTSESTPQKTELRRIWQGASTGESTGVYGYVAAPITRLEKLTDSSWSDVSETCIFVGPTMEAVMHYLHSYTGGKWPRFAKTYSISGTVSGVVASGVTMTLSGDTSATTTTAADGTYTFSNLADGNYTVTPSKSGYIFSPTSIAVTISGANQSGINFTSTATQTYSISGVITYNGSGLSGVTVKAGSVSTTTATNGTYTISGLANGTYTVTPSMSGYTFSPTSLSVTISGANQTGKNFTATATQTYSISGTITYNGSGLSGVTVKAGSVSTTTATDGTYTISGLANGTYTVTPTKTGYTFSPTSRSVTISGANITGQDFTASVASGQFSISGSLKMNSGAAMADYTMNLSGAAAAVTKTDKTGNYSFTGLSNGSYIVEPQPCDFLEFTPAYRSVTISGSNITEVNFIAKKIIIKGTVTDIQGNGVSGVTITAGDATAITDMKGNYYFTEKDLPLGNYTLAPGMESAVVYTFAPSSIPVTISSFDTTITEQNFTVTHK